MSDGFSPGMTGLFRIMLQKYTFFSKNKNKVTGINPATLNGLSGVI